MNNARWLSAYDIKIDDLNLDYKIIEGELWLKSKTQILGYLNASMENFNSDGWFCTGDSVLLCDDGFMKIIGRTQEVINVGGEKVLPAEVESVLLEIEGVDDCLVYAKANSITGQSVNADIIKTDNIDKKTLKNIIRKICFQRLERYKVPTRIAFVEKITDWSTL